MNKATNRNRVIGSKRAVRSKWVHSGNAGLSTLGSRGRRVTTASIAAATSTISDTAGRIARAARGVLHVEMDWLRPLWGRMAPVPQYAQSRASGRSATRRPRRFGTGPTVHSSARRWQHRGLGRPVASSSNRNFSRTNR